MNLQTIMLIELVQVRIAYTCADSITVDSASLIFSGKSTRPLAILNLDSRTILNLTTIVI